MSLTLFVLICFTLGTGMWMVVDHPKVKGITRWVGGLGGIIYGLLRLFEAFN